jgi:hypothetical protein
MNEFVLPGLVKRRAALAGELEAAQAKARQFFADLAAVDAVIRQLDPGYPVDAIAAKRLRGPAHEARGYMSRAVLDVLRRADGPLTTAAVAERVAALRGPGLPGGPGQAAIKNGVGRALKHQRSLGAVWNPPSEGRLVLWGLAE